MRSTTMNLTTTVSYLMMLFAFLNDLCGILCVCLLAIFCMLLYKAIDGVMNYCTLCVMFSIVCNLTCWSLSTLIEIPREAFISFDFILINVSSLKNLIYGHFSIIINKVYSLENLLNSIEEINSMKILIAANAFWHYNWNEIKSALNSEW